MKGIGGDDVPLEVGLLVKLTGDSLLAFGFVLEIANALGGDIHGHGGPDFVVGESDA